MQRRPIGHVLAGRAALNGRLKLPAGATAAAAEVAKRRRLREAAREAAGAEEVDRERERGLGVMRGWTGTSVHCGGGDAYLWPGNDKMTGVQRWCCNRKGVAEIRYHGS